MCLLCGCKTALNQTSNHTSEKSTESASTTNEYTVNSLLSNEIPVPSNAEVRDNQLMITDKTPKEIMTDYQKLLSDSGWAQVDGLGLKRIYAKEINGEDVRISVLSMQESGIQDKSIETVIQLAIVDNTKK